MRLHLILSVLLGCGLLAAAERNLPAGFAPSVLDYGAVGDGVHDDTAALTAAFNGDRTDALAATSNTDYYAPRPRTVHIPAGTYLVSGPIRLIGQAITLQGDGAHGTVIRLKDACAGFTDSASPQPVIRTQEGNHCFRIHVYDLTIDVGSGNPGAKALRWTANNVGCVRDVVLRSRDGQGYSGLDMTAAWPGPSLVQHLTVDGFAVGIDVARGEYGPAFCDLLLRRQTVAGLRNSDNPITIQNLVSENSVPAILCTGNSAMPIVLGATCRGGDASRCAIETTTSAKVYLRQVTATGYDAVLKQGTTVSGGSLVAEYSTGPTTSLFTSPDASLKLPIRTAPRLPDGDLAGWAMLESTANSDLTSSKTATNQAKFNLASNHTIWVPPGPHLAGGDVNAFTVPAHIKRVVGFNGVANKYSSGNTYALRLIVSATTSDPLSIEEFGYGVTVQHQCARPLVLRHGWYRYEAQAGAGDLWLDDVGINRRSVDGETLALQTLPGQKVWARQLNIEGETLHIANEGADLVIMGLKTEQGGPVLRTRYGGRSEFLGTLLYPLGGVDPAVVAFENIESSHSLVYASSNYSGSTGDYKTQVREVRGGSSATSGWNTNYSGRRFMPLHRGYQAADAPPANTAPTVTSAAQASPLTVTGDSSTLTVAGNANDAGDTLAVTWFAGGAAPAPVAVRPNGTEDASTATARFRKAGTYAFTAVLRDQGCAAATSQVTVTVRQSASSLSLAPGFANLPLGGAVTFALTGTDQFGDPILAAPPGTVWSVDAHATVVSGTATGSSPGLATITATQNGVSVSALVGIQGAGAPVFSQALSLSLAPNRAFTWTIPANGSSYFIQDLPAGWTLSGGVLSGIAPASGTLRLLVGVNNADGCTLGELVVTIATPPASTAGSALLALPGGGDDGCGLGLGLVLLAGAWLTWRRERPQT